MPFRQQYLADIGLPNNPYPANAAQRVRQIYGTARRGQISTSEAQHLWSKHLQKAFAAPNTIPKMQPGYDAFVVNLALAIETDLVAAGRGGFGVAQKVVNLFMKDLWAFGVLPPKVAPLLHAPLDRRILSKLKHVPSTWNPWTKAKTISAKSTTAADYLTIQATLRSYLLNPTRPAPHPPLFGSVIDMEQFLWHSIG